MLGSVHEEAWYVTCVCAMTWHRVRRAEGWLTGYHIARVHGILVLDKAEAIHELNLRDLAGAMGVEVVLNIGLGSCEHKVQSATPEVQAKPAPSQLRIQRIQSTEPRMSISQGEQGKGAVISSQS